MKTIFKSGYLILVPEDDAERTATADWKPAVEGHVFALQPGGSGLAFRDLGARADVCREPINVTSRHPDAAIRLIGNFAATPFWLDGAEYASVESFWQGLKFDDAKERRRIAALDGAQARRVGDEQGYGDTVEYAGRRVRVGTRDHWDLMEAACRAKFLHHPEARDALLATGDRPLVHRTRRDSRTIPGVIMADIWMRIRRSLRVEDEPAEEEQFEAGVDADLESGS